MSEPPSFLSGLHERGKPLVDISINPAPGEPPGHLAEIINGLGPDIEVYVSPHCAEGDPGGYLVGLATKEALHKIFDWALVRTRIDHYPDFFHWEERNRPSIPHGLHALIEGIYMSEPGSADAGNDDTVSY